MLKRRRWDFITVGNQCCQKTCPSVGVPANWKGVCGVLVLYHAFPTGTAEIVLKPLGVETKGCAFLFVSPD